jgi:novel protein kinase C epsilon type
MMKWRGERDGYGWYPLADALIDSTRSEKRVFLAAARERHPFLLGLHSCFQTKTRVYFVMEYVSGGDLMLHIQRKQFSLRQAKFYASEVLLALEYFHANGIIYRYVFQTLATAL